MVWFAVTIQGLKLPSGFRESRGGYHNIQMFVSFHLSPHKLPRPRDRSELARYELVLPPLPMLEAYGTRVMTPRRSSVLFSDVEIQGVVLNFTNSALWVEMLYSGDITCQKLCSRIAAAPREWQVRLGRGVIVVQPCSLDTAVPLREQTSLGSFFL